MIQVRVPGGMFLMGSPDDQGDDDEHPQHSVYLNAFWIDKTEVTNAMFAAFLNEMGNQSEGTDPWFDENNNRTVEDVGIVFGSHWQPKMGYAEHPIISVNWFGAQAYCQWASRRLPTEAEWEKAARGGLEAAKYPWGDEDPGCTPASKNGTQYYDCSDQTVKAATFAPNGYGLYDMAGNVWEWVSDWYDSSYYDTKLSSNPVGPDSGYYHVLRGGSGYSNESHLRTSYRHGPNNTGYLNGFRCALSTSP
jgi:formylglycine-generating enzyme required for sulfatase activity